MIGGFLFALHRYSIPIGAKRDKALVSLLKPRNPEGVLGGPAHLRRVEQAGITRPGERVKRSFSEADMGGFLMPKKTLPAYGAGLC
jgi:hypothetical protein